MPERLTTALDDGTIATLQALAGGPRKIGGYLSELARWLWAHRQTVQGADFASITIISSNDLAAWQMALQGRGVRDEREFRKLRAEVDALTRKLDELSQKVDEYGDEDTADGNANRDAHGDA